jgi:hypothetical protein
MPCYQPSSLPSGVTTTGRTGYATEADCLAACKEGACCEGTTCSVKPQCQCNSDSLGWGSCCGPDTATNIGGQTGLRCRTETKAACLARGGVWRYKVPCTVSSDDSPANSICQTTTSSTPEPTFKGVGTVCTPNPCGCCGNGETIAGKTATVYVSTDSMPVLRWCPQVIGGSAIAICPDGNTYGGCVSQKPCETPTYGGPWIDTSFSASATFTSNAAASSCSASLAGQCPGLGSRSASVFLQPSPCKIYATVDCSSLIAAVDSYRGRFSVNPYWAWDYGSQTSEYNTRYYVFQYLSGTGISTVTQSINSTPVSPDITGYFWYLSKTVTVNMRLTLV